MPVVRARSPRVEGGRCYPRVCWVAVTRATHWGMANPVANTGTSTLKSHLPTPSCPCVRPCRSSCIYSGTARRNAGASGQPGDSCCSGVCNVVRPTPVWSTGVRPFPISSTTGMPSVPTSSPQARPRTQLSHLSQQSPQRQGNTKNHVHIMTPRQGQNTSQKLRCDQRGVSGQGLSNQNVAGVVVVPALAPNGDDASDASDAISASHTTTDSASDCYSGSDEDSSYTGTPFESVTVTSPKVINSSNLANGNWIKSAVIVSTADAVERQEGNGGGAPRGLHTGLVEGASNHALIYGGFSEDSAKSYLRKQDNQVSEAVNAKPRQRSARDDKMVMSGVVSAGKCKQSHSHQVEATSPAIEQNVKPMIRQNTFTVDSGQRCVPDQNIGNTSSGHPVVGVGTRPNSFLDRQNPRQSVLDVASMDDTHVSSSHTTNTTSSPLLGKSRACTIPLKGISPQRRRPHTAGKPWRRCVVVEAGGMLVVGEGAEAHPLISTRGHRGSGSSKRGAPYTRGNNNNNEDPESSVHSEQQKEPRTSQPQQQQFRGRRAMKISVREDASRKTASLNTPVSRTRSGSRSSGGSSPATLHGRAPHKTAIVAPAPTKFSAKAGSLNRFGFRNSAHVKSGDSTDSVNSILSDAQTVSDSNSNIFELCDDENENTKSTKDLSSTPSNTSSNIQPQKILELTDAQSNKTASVNSIPKHSLAAQSGRITAFTRQLPKPQVVTVKSVSPKSQAIHRSNSPKHQSPKPSPNPKPQVTPRSFTSKLQSPKTKPQNPLSKDMNKSSSIKSLVHPIAKNHMEHGTKGKPQSNGTTQRMPRVSRDSESSTRSGTEADSGLGSSSESDKIRGEGETDTLGSVNTVESSEDVSDAWLRNKKQEQSAIKRRSGNMEVRFNGTGAFELKRQNLESKGTGMTESPLSPTLKSETPQEKKTEPNKEKAPITYGMARQKFAPYSRSRFGYGYQSGNGSDKSGGSSSSSSSSTPSSNVTKVSGSSGLVKNRIAMLETTPSGKSPQSSVLRRTNIKKPLVRPTSLEKTPLLVMPVTEKTVELSQPVCRRLEYSECDTQTDLHSDLQEGSTIKTVAEDILMVGSVEVETRNDGNLVLEVENYGSYYKNAYDKGTYIGKEDKPLKISPDSLSTSCEQKARKDISESEKIGDKKEHEKVLVNNVNKDVSSRLLPCPDKDLPVKKEEDTKSEMVNHQFPMSPDDVASKILTPLSESCKLLTPQSESSFEILESLSEATDLIPEEIKEVEDKSVIEVETSYASKATTVEVQRESSADSNVSLAGSVSASSIEEMSAMSDEQDKSLKLSELSKGLQNIVVKSTSDLCSEAQSTKSQSSLKSSVASPTDEKKLKQSTDSKSAVEPSVESQKSSSLMNVMVESSDRSTLSGKWTPTLNSTRGDLDQDFLIDDEIADQPGLMFGGSTMASSFFTDDGIFDDMTSSSPSHGVLKPVVSNRSRADSVDTASSLGADDLMLDFDVEDAKAGGYDEEVLSPDASEIFSEWTAMMAEVGSSVLPERCVSRDGSSGSNRASRPRLSSSSEHASPESRRPTVLRPPRQGSVSEVEGGGVCLDRTSYHYMCQDVTALKTMLLRLRRILQQADTINPFDANLRNSLYLSLASSDSPGGTSVNGDKDSLTPSLTEISQENVDLRRQVVLLQQQLEERDRTIRMLQQQLAQSIGNQQTACISPEANPSATTVNAATQTERSARPTLTGSSLSRAASIDDGLGPTVSSEKDCDRTERGRSASTPEHRQPRAISQPPTPFSH